MRKRAPKQYEMDREGGYGVNLYRNIRDKKVGGVCAGLADHFEISHWVMRITFIGASFMTSGAFLWVYPIAWALLAPRPERVNQARQFFEYDEEERCYRKKNLFRYQDSASTRIGRAKNRLDKLATRIEGVERYVTSRRFDLDREFSQLED